MSKVAINIFFKWVIMIIATCMIITFLFFPFMRMNSLSYAITINFLLMIWISIVESVIRPELKSSYFDSKHFERDGKIYKYLGVHFYRKLLKISGWEKERKEKTPIIKKINALEYYEYRTRASEFGHGVIAIIIAIISIYVYRVYSLKETIALVLLNIFLNIYPIFVQRYNRPRVQRVIKKLKMKINQTND